jgi:hypothetical protein
LALDLLKLAYEKRIPKMPQPKTFNKRGLYIGVTQLRVILNLQRLPLNYGISIQLRKSYVYLKHSWSLAVNPIAALTCVNYIMPAQSYGW